MEDYKKKYLKYKMKYLSLKQQLSPTIPNPISNTSVLNTSVLSPSIPVPIPNKPVV
jgi:hypothetical protein